MFEGYHQSLHPSLYVFSLQYRYYSSQKLPTLNWLPMSIVRKSSNKVLSKVDYGNTYHLGFNFYKTGFEKNSKTTSSMSKTKIKNNVPKFIIVKVLV